MYSPATRFNIYKPCLNGRFIQQQQTDESTVWNHWLDIDGLVQERRNSSALAMELHLSCINPSIYDLYSLANKICLFCLAIVISPVPDDSSHL